MNELNIFEKYLTSPLGLKETEVKKRLKEYGYNQITEKKRIPFFLRFIRQFKDFLVIILLIASIVSVIANPHEWIESIIIFIVVLINAFIGVIQEVKAEKTLNALKELIQPLTKVIRNNEVHSIESRLIVPGDILVFASGDKIVADGVIIEASNLEINESSITGESLPVKKVVIEDSENEHCSISSSALVTNGSGKAIVTKTGMNTTIGQIAHFLNTSKETITPLQKKLDQIGKVIGILCIFICIVVFVLEVMISPLPFLDSFPPAFLSAIALTVAAIPEGLTAIVTVILTIGIEKMVKKNAIIKKLPAVETLGCTNVICCDKTGTLTQNKMTVQSIYTSKLHFVNESLSQDEEKLLSLFALCCDANVYYEDNKRIEVGDPTEIALINVANEKVKKNFYPNIKRVGDIPFDSERKMMSVIYQVNNEYLVITKGAVDQVLSKCLNKKQLDVLLVNNQMADLTLRVLALGIKKIKQLPKVINSSSIESNLLFMGLVGMKDPIRPEVKAVIKKAKQAGILTIMITGDHINTATAIAKELELINDDSESITANELHHLSDKELMSKINNFKVYARVSPHDKMRIIEAWQKKGAVVAMTGDGVNDAPALKKADIGCAMGITGTDVAKDAADLILVDDNFSTIVDAVEEGRTIYDNIKKVIQYLLSSNIGEVLTIFLATLLAFFLPKHHLGIPLSAIHLLWINLITDSFPAFALGMEKGEKDNMEKQPRNQNEHFFAHGLGFSIITQGIFISLLTLTSFVIGYLDNYDLTLAQTMAFVTLSSAQLFHAFNIKSRNSIFHWSTFNNIYLIGAFFLGLILMLVLLYIPTLSEIFKVVPLKTNYLIISIGLGAMIIIFTQFFRKIKLLLQK